VTAGVAEGAEDAAGGAGFPAERALPVLSLVAGHRAQPPRTPFVVLVLGVLGTGLVALLLLNSALAADSFAQRRLQRQNTELSLREQELAREIAALEAPGALATAARRLGLVPSGERGFLIIDKDGRAHVVGSAVPATVPPPPTPSPSPTPTAARPGQQTAGTTPGRTGTPQSPGTPQSTSTPGSHR
jgi:cell division protein FtsB